MTRYLLAALIALLAAGHASADYLLIVVNLNAKASSSDSTQSGMLGGPPIGGGQLGGPPQAGGPKPGGMLGGPPPQGGGAIGLGGNLGGGALGLRGGMGNLGGPPGPGSGPKSDDDVDESPDLIVAVIEVKTLTKEAAKLFAAGKKEVKFVHNWGKVDLVHKTVSYEATLLGSKDSPLPTVKERFAARKKKVMDGSKPTTREVIKDVALFALELGLVDECAEVMDELAASDKADAAVKAYLTVKAALAKPLANDKDEASKWKTKLLEGYKVTQDDKHHFALIHPNQSNGKAQLARLEHAFRAYYYWWALRSVALPVPSERLVSVQTEKTDDFVRLRTNFTASPSLADSFFARRELVSVFASQRTDASYDKLSKAAQPWWTANFDRNELLTGIPNKGLPKTNKPAEKIAYAQAAKEPRTLALLLKAMENEFEQTGISHEASRQMLYATKQLPRNVHAPEWVQFGVGSFFETPLQAPWPTIGAANPYWLPRFKELQSKKKYEASYAQTLKKIVTDSYFREKTKGDKAEEIAKSREANLRKARAASWALTYYLARYEANLPKLQRYFKELSKQPRDVDLDEKTLWECFTRAFGLDSEDKVRAFAGNWMAYLQAERVDATLIHEKIRKFYTEMNTPPAPKQGNTGNTGGGLVPPGPRR
jgi:hypothetical protein